MGRIAPCCHPILQQIAASLRAPSRSLSVTGKPRRTLHCFTPALRDPFARRRTLPSHRRELSEESDLTRYYFTSAVLVIIFDFPRSVNRTGEFFSFEFPIAAITPPSFCVLCPLFEDFPPENHLFTLTNPKKYSTITELWGYSAVGSAFEWHSKGQGFESP